MGSISFWMFCTWNKTIGCSWMRTLPRSPSMFQVFSNNTITMLQKMVGYRVMFIHLFLVIELLQVNNLKADEQMAFISHTLKLYSRGKYESTAWDQKGVDKFMNYLYRQTSNCSREPRSDSDNKQIWVRRPVAHLYNKNTTLTINNL
uniref:Uncharacterized protein n=1 Tax=Oncorhynchus kisutch TaxID=8019 RepID=A0A8C7FSJ3_ONCKI